MSKTELFIVRHGKTMFNTMQRAQGWCDTPLTQAGREGIHQLALGMKDIEFVSAFSSDSGRAIETARIILEQNPKRLTLPYATDPRLREWCWGSLEGGYDAEMWGVIPRVLNFKTSDEMFDTSITFEDIANAVYAADTANWAEPYQKIKERVYNGFEDIAHRVEKNGGGKSLVVCHGFTIAFLLNLIDPKQPVRAGLDNGSVTRLTYENGTFTIDEIGSVDYILKGKELTEAAIKKTL
ncbi:MAG: histidine phosphatase family protein [Enterococcus sp.]